jgi:shikimate kinase
MNGIILGTGGGSVIRKANRDKLKQSGIVVYLRSSADMLYSRISHDKSRPLMQTDNPLQTLKDLLQEREPYYMEVADIVVNTGKQRVSGMIVELVRKIKQVEELS